MEEKMDPILKESFPHYLVYCWRFLSLPDPTPVQIDMARFMQNGGRRIGIEAFRGVGKSWICSAYATWLLLRDPQCKILVVSASRDRSDAFTIFTKRLIWEMPILRHLKPDKAKGDRLSNVACDVRPARPAHAPSVKSVGITGQMAGSRADFIIADDVEVPNNSETALMREKLLVRIAEMGGAILTPTAQAGEDGGVIFLGTPQVEDTMYNKLNEQGYEFRIWPAEVPENPANYQGKLAPMIQKMVDDGIPAGTPTDPKRFDEVELQERLHEYRASGYALQFQLDTSLVDADLHPLKLSDFIVAATGVEVCNDKFEWSNSPEYELGWAPLCGLPRDKFFGPMFKAEQHSPYDGAVMYIDPSGRGKDETAYAVVKSLHGFLIIRRWGGDPGG
ncbi:MAG: phage terminase large subunit, partial [Dehalococcoidia bacterium]